MRFALIGAAGYIAPRHLIAIQETGNELVAALDPSDSVGILDRYFPDAAFFTEPERFDRHLSRLRRRGEGVDYVAIASPNYLHDAHIHLALRVGAHAICEKPLVIMPRNLDPLAEWELEHDRRINVVLQLRLHPEIVRLREKLSTGMHDVELRYVTPRGKWYQYSWKGNPERSGGLTMNIGIHFFDLLLWLFGPLHRESVTIKDCTSTTVSGSFRLERASVRWFLSIDAKYLRPGTERDRSMLVDGLPVDFTNGFDGLHTAVYREILAGRGFGLSDARPAIELVHLMRSL